MNTWQLRREPRAICLSIFQGGSEIVHVNPRGDYDDDTEANVACGLVCMPEMHQFVKRRAEAGDSEAAALLTRIEHEYVTAAMLLRSIKDDRDDEPEEEEPASPEPDPDRWHDERHEREEARLARLLDDDIAF